ncbi:Mediator of RNA polymerase II transcription subunit 19 [Cytospora mali]|uniref:Mediator of RNA polymerase II transcription subunit 19 n=1 Tax=Cytospora mali TaxID=578113 RepID=A0A194W5F7_CYTMA|nr:Mediator of RNA polymerase II transcription subunit 19 [Valsa mali]
MSFHPQTPQSPSHFSPSTTEPTVHSTMTSFTTNLPTPAHSINGTSLSLDSTHDMGMGEDSPQKRKRAQEDVGGQGHDEKRLHVDDGLPSIKDMHEDVGEKYLLLQKTWQPAQPVLSEDLFEMYDLTGIAGEVARVLPDGSKNALRKTYKGQIKKLGLMGHFDAVKKEPNDPNGLLSLLSVPDQEWHVHFVQGKDIEDGLRPDVKNILTRATSMARGTIPRNKWDTSVLADFAGGPKGSSAKATATAPGTPLNPALSGVPRPKPLGIMVQEATRPRRANKKRSYGDSSFEGYEGYLDDETGAETGYSTGEGEGAKRRKKIAKSRVGTPRQAYGPGMVGV